MYFSIRRNFGRATQKMTTTTTTTFIEITYFQPEIKLTGKNARKKNDARLKNELSKYAPKICIASKRETGHCSIIKCQMNLVASHFLCVLFFHFRSIFFFCWVFGSMCAMYVYDWSQKCTVKRIVNFVDCFFCFKCVLCASVTEFGLHNVYVRKSMVSEWMWLCF